MIYLNGYIRFVTIDEQVNEYGDSLSTPTYSDFIPCMYQAMQNDKRGAYKDGKYKQVAYEVHLSPMKVIAERAELLDEDRNSLGEYPIQSVTKYHNLPRVGITLGV